MRQNSPFVAFLLASLLVLLILIICSLSVGGSPLGLAELIEWLGAVQPDKSKEYIFSGLRVPRTLATVLVGAALGISGCLLQSLLQNPLAEPYTLGISGGASLGAVAAIALSIKPHWLSVPAGALIGCLIVTALIVRISLKKQLWSQKVLILVGVMLSLFCGSLVVVILSFFEPSKLQTAINFMIGQVGTERDHWWWVLATLLIPTLVYTMLNHRQLDNLLLGEELAISLGTPLKNLRTNIVVLVALLTATSVAIAGIVGFAGLLAPHLALLIVRTGRHQKLLPMSALLGAIFFLAADTLGRFVGGVTEIPAGSVVSLIGAPVFVYLLLRRSKHAAME